MSKNIKYKKTNQTPIAYKVSDYNFFIQKDKKRNCFLFNGIKSSLIHLPSPVFEATKLLFSQKQINHNELSRLNSEFVDILKEGGFIVPSSDNELEVIRNKFLSDKNDSALEFLFVPTLDCNLSCIYCYQERFSTTMSKNICKKIINLAQEKLLNENINRINVDWYGGEPLLAFNTISYLSSNLIDLSEKHNCSYNASITTNGTLLNAKMLDLLLSLFVSKFQVSIDGPRETHDKRRMYKHEKISSFDRIIENIYKIVDKADLYVRINVDNENLEQAFTLLEYFKEKGLFNVSSFGFYPYLAMTGPLNPCKPFNCNPLVTGKFYKKNMKFQKRVFEYSNKKKLYPIFDYPFALGVPCGALKNNFYCFDPKGRYYKCGIQIGELDKHCGDVNGTLNHTQNELWEQYTPLKDEECVECKYLPFCMGGCPKVLFDKNSFYDKEGCEYWKNHLEEIIRIYANGMENLN